VKVFLDIPFLKGGRYLVGHVADKDPCREHRSRFLAWHRIASLTEMRKEAYIEVTRKKLSLEKISREAARHENPVGFRSCKSSGQFNRRKARTITSGKGIPNAQMARSREIKPLRLSLNLLGAIARLRFLTKRKIREKVRIGREVSESDLKGGKKWPRLHTKREKRIGHGKSR